MSPYSGTRAESLPGMYVRQRQAVCHPLLYSMIACFCTRYLLIATELRYNQQRAREAQSRLSPCVNYSPPSVELQQKPGGTASHHRARSSSRRRDTDDSASLQFNGARIIDAVFDVLENTSALHNYTGVVLAGSSAGAVRAAIHAPRLQVHIDASAAMAGSPASSITPAPHVHILADSGWFVELPPTPGDLVSRTHASLDRIRAGIPVWNSSAVLLPACGQTSSLSECYCLEYLSTQQTLPAFYLNSVQDLVLLDELVDPKGPSLPDLASYLHSWAGSLRYSFTRASQAWAEREDSVADRSLIFAPACLQHVFFSATVEDLASSRESYDG